MVSGFMKDGKFIPAGRRFNKATKVQSLILDKDNFKTVSNAKSKVKELGFKASKVDKTVNTFRFRQIDPHKCQQGKFAVIDITDGIQAVICEPK